MQRVAVAQGALEFGFDDRVGVRVFVAACVADGSLAFGVGPAGTERMGRKLQDALPGGENPLRTAVWEFLRPMLSPTLVSLNRDAFVSDDDLDSTVDISAHRASSELAELDLRDEPE